MYKCTYVEMYRLYTYKAYGIRNIIFITCLFSKFLFTKSRQAKIRFAVQPDSP